MPSALVRVRPRWRARPADPSGAALTAVRSSAANFDQGKLTVTVTSGWQPGADVTVSASYPYSIKLLGWVVGRRQPHIQDHGEGRMTYQLRNVVIAVVLGLLAAVLTIVYVTSYRNHVQHNQQQVGVLVAATDIPAGTSGAAIASGQHAQARDRTSHGTRSRCDLEPHPGFPSRLDRRDHGRRAGLDAPLRRRERARRPRAAQGHDAGRTALGHSNQVLAGTLRAGDHVDLVANMSVGNTNGIPQHYDRIFLRNLLVLRAPPHDAKTGSVSVGDQKLSVMLAVTDSQSTKLMFILRNSDANTSSDGGWALELRPVTNAADSPENVESLNTVLVDGLSAAERSRVAEGH